ncbi:hypothetical protein NE237_006777 [Protea cynaroides]|uniref:Uncharacterized protein n=1 Tax=Protea cynaroides TaxID=273540 RepID=A0A9Q0QVM6_9MAGN|nr:hypothetical protein NE237_006777 [Protea cynaroides]
MALPLQSFQLQSCIRFTLPRRQPPLLFHHNRIQFCDGTRLRLNPTIVTRKGRGNSFFPPKSASINGFSVLSTTGEREDGNKDVTFMETLQRWVVFLRSIMPGGSWWNFSEDVEVFIFSKPVTVWFALRRMWELVANDRLVIFIAVVALVIAALSEISTPHFLAASIFSAQGGETMVFHRNAQMLVLLCFTSGICRSKSCMVKVPCCLNILD